MFSVVNVSVVDVCSAVPFGSPWAPNPCLCTGCCRAQPRAGGTGGPRAPGWVIGAGQGALDGGRELAHHWKGKLGYISGLKSLDGNPFILGFS